MPQISVIVPTHNRAAFLEECLTSVLEQTHSDYELIVVDDGSTDDTLKKLEPFASKLTVFQQEQQGPSSARNKGILEAKGEWLCFLDSDDLWLPQKLERQCSHLDAHPESRIGYTEEIWFRKGVRVNPKKRHKKPSGWIYLQMLPLCLVSPSSVMIHRSVFEKVGLFDESLPACEDYDLWLRIGAHYPFLLLPEALIIKRNGHLGQQSEKYWGMDRFRIQSLAQLLEKEHLSEENRRATQEMLKKKCSVMIQGSEKRGKLEEATKYKILMNQHP